MADAKPENRAASKPNEDANEADSKVDVVPFEPVRPEDKDKPKGGGRATGDPMPSEQVRPSE